MLDHDMLGRMLPTLDSVQLVVDSSTELPETGIRGQRAWEAWSRTIVGFGFEHEPVGRYARSLRRLPRTLWHVPLRQFATESLACLRSRPWFGRKKLGVVGEVLQDLATTLEAQRFAAAEPPRIRIAPIVDAEWRLLERIADGGGGGLTDLAADVVPRLLEQIEQDVGSLARRAWTSRLPAAVPAETCSRRAARLGISRARYYQLLADGRTALRLRWPEGPAIWWTLANQCPDEAWPDLFGDADT
jgi:hypothetical protein